MDDNNPPLDLTRYKVDLTKYKQGLNLGINQKNFMLYSISFGRSNKIKGQIKETIYYVVLIY